MLGLQKVDHVGIRVRSKEISIAFYEGLGFETLTDAGFDQGHPVILQHPCGVVLNLLGPANANARGNILMDMNEKHPGITHVAFKIDSMDETKALLAEKTVEITGEFSFKGMHAIFIRDPDRNVIELDAYAGEEPLTRARPGADAIEGYKAHPE